MYRKYNREPDIAELIVIFILVVGVGIFLGYHFIDTSSDPIPQQGCATVVEHLYAPRRRSGKVTYPEEFVLLLETPTGYEKGQTDIETFATIENGDCVPYSVEIGILSGSVVKVTVP